MQTIVEAVTQVAVYIARRLAVLLRHRREQGAQSRASVVAPTYRAYDRPRSADTGWGREL